MFNKLFFSLFFLSSFILSQSELEKGITQYNLRHSGCVENKAKSEPITKAISYFENALDDDKDKDEASLYLLKSYYFKSKFVLEDKKLKKEFLKKGKNLGQEYVEKFPESVEYRYWYLVNLGSWAEEYGILAAAREGVADQMRFHSKKIIELDPNYENGAGYFLLGAVHYKSPYVPFILSWPSNKDAIMWLQSAYDTGEAEIAQVVYLAQALNKDKKKEAAVDLLKMVIERTPSVDNYASDWEWLKKAKRILKSFGN